MDVVDKIAAVETGRKRGFDDVPVEAVIMKSVRRERLKARVAARSWPGRLLRRSLPGCSRFAAAASVLLVLLLRWINPPFSAFMARRRSRRGSSRDSSYVSATPGSI
jgi:hypothetical protein